MRHAGRISNWNDQKGFGFVTPHDGGARAFWVTVLLNLVGFAVLWQRGVAAAWTDWLLG